MDELFEDAVFFRLKTQLPDFRKKVVAVEGDCELPGLGLNAHDSQTLIREVKETEFLIIFIMSQLYANKNP